MKNLHPTVLHLIGGGEFGGAEQHIVTLLPRLQERGVQPLLGCLYSRSPLAEKIQAETDIATELFPMRAPFDLSPLPRLLRFCAQHEVNLIHSHGLRADILGRAAALISRLPAITTWHSWPENDFPGALTGKIGMKLEQMTFGLSAGSIAVSNALTEKLENWPPMRRRIHPRHVRPNRPVSDGSSFNGTASNEAAYGGTAPNEAASGGTAPNQSINNRATHKKNYLYQTIYNGYTPRERTPEEYSQARHYYRGLWHIPDNALVLGSVGRLHPVKGHRTLLEAANRLAHNHPQLHILLIGDGPERPSLEQRLQAAPYAHTLAGHLPDAERALPALDIFVFPSLHEGMGIALLEAIQARLPIVASAVGGIPEVLRAGTDALLVPPADADALASACRRLLEDPLLRQNLTAAALQRLALFCPQTMADQTAAFYRRVLHTASD